MSRSPDDLGSPVLKIDARSSNGMKAEVDASRTDMLAFFDAFNSDYELLGQFLSAKYHDFAGRDT